MSKPTVMTRADLYDWVIAHGCTVTPLSEIKAKVIWVKNPDKPGREAWINLPIDERLVYDFTVCKVCLDLGIEIPTHLTYMKSVHDHIEKQVKSGSKKYPEK